MVLDVRSRLGISDKGLAEFSKRWKITELALFGSALRDDFGPESDIDLLVTFGGDESWDLFDLADMQGEMKVLIGRDVDMVEKKALLNPFRRHNILKQATVIYAV
jgi:predicted nucleotidyltransferase